MNNNCSIFKKSLFKDADISSFNLELDWLKGLIPEYNPSYSGIWLPIVIKPDQSSVSFVDILSRSELEQSLFDPCNCIAVTGDSGDEEDPENVSLDCSYCYKNGINYTFSWQLTDQNSNISSPPISSNCCNGACDARMLKDDYLAKLPVLNASYITKFYDWKNQLQFPACSNKGLGYEHFAFTKKLDSFTNDVPKLMIDWKIKERISEIPPNDIDSYHQDIDTHEKSYTRSLLNSKTCGNFLLTKLHPSYDKNPIYPALSGLIGDIAMTGNFSKLLPSVSNFSKPYGFKNQDHYNIFAKTEKLGSYWKWNYSSGILCWYRYFDIDLDPNEDDRLIKGVDLYISDGDVFYATNDGPEPLPVDQNQTPPDIKLCPSGLKLVKDNAVTGIIPSGSEFIYISENLYSKAYSIIGRLDDLEAALDIPNADKISPINKLQLSCLLATGPNYSEVTVDLLKTVPNIDDLTKDYSRDLYKQIKIFNSGMLLKQQHSANKLNIVKTKTDLMNTLANKYGCYLWCPPHSTISLDFKKDYDPHCYIDLDFEPVIKYTDTFFGRQCTPPIDCLDTTTERNFSYDQKVVVGDLTFNTSVDKRYKSQNCVSGEFTIDKAVNIISAYFNDQLIKEQIYGSGCSVFYQKYLRPVSYELALDTFGESICSVHRLCDKLLAFKYNNDNNWFGTTNELKEGKFLDGSLILDRRYPANASNINVDRIGFHRDGGLYYDSNNLGSGNVIFIKDAENSTRGSFSISFSTKDVGIKLYNIEIYHLRDATFTNCKTFPLDHACKCFPLSSVTGYRYNCDGSLTFSNENAVLYTPNLSTQSSPILTSYGGYSTLELTKIIGEQLLPNHPDPGELLSTVNRIIDPLNPYGCTKEIAASFPSYVYTNWHIGLPNYSTDHTDVWMKVIENVSLFNPTIPKYDYETGEFEIINNPSYRRYTTKAVVNGTTIYNSQQKILFDKDTSIPGSFQLELTNPFLFSLLSQLSEDMERNKLLYTNLPCSLDTTNRDSYLNNINIIFKQVPRKQLLNYKLRPISSAGNLEKIFFHPNKGIVKNTELFNLTSLIYNPQDCSFDFAYEKELFENGARNYSDSGVMFSGHISDDIQQILALNDNLLNHKKLRLYIKYNNIWYEYLNPHIFGFHNKFNNNLYPGPPTLFEYTKHDKYKTQLNMAEFVDERLNRSPLPNITSPSQFIPASAKVNTELLYLHNIKPTGTIHGLSTEFYPILTSNFRLDKNSKRKIVLQGSRPYFMFEEKDPAIFIQDITRMNSDEQNTIFRNTFVMDANGYRWRYKGEGTKTSLDSYELVPPRNYLDANFNELWIDYLNNNDDGYIANTELQTTSTAIKLIDKYNPKISYEYNVISKSLYAKRVNRFGNDLDKFAYLKDREHLDVYTILEIDICQDCSLKLSDGIVQLVLPQANAEQPNTDSFVVLQNFKDSLKAEAGTLLRNQYYETKWGDLINFDNKTLKDLNNSKILNQNLSRCYPPSLYDNILYNISINNLDTGNFRFLITSKNNITNDTNSGVTNYDGPIYYNIHQKYNIGLDNLYLSSTIKDYQNYLPIIDLNFIKGNKTRNQSWSNNLMQNFINNSISTGQLYISGIRSFVDNTSLKIDPNQVSAFFVSLDKNTKLRPVLFNKDFYYDTLRVDDVYYRLISLEQEQIFNTNGCSTIFMPKINFSAQTFTDYFDTNGFDLSTPIIKTTFDTLPIYCDTDKPAELCGNESCSIKTAGFTKLKAGYQHYKYNYLTPKDLESVNTLEFALSVDEGLYNTVGINMLPYIQRFEIPPNSNLFNNITLDGTDDCVIGSDNRPPRPQNYVDTEYQNKLVEYILLEDNKGDLVKNTDILANEMLFRLIYGSKETISYDTIKKKTTSDLILDNTKKSVSYLLQYSNPRTTPDLIYNLIPYDYSIYADSSKRKINGSINIEGVLSVGSNVSINIGGYLISIAIQNINNKICAVASCNGKTYTSPFFDTRPTTVSTTAVTAGTVLYPPNENSDVVKITTCRGGVTPLSWSLGKYFTSMEIGSEENKVDLAAEYRKCIAATNGGCYNGQVPVNPSILSLFVYGWGGLCPLTCQVCDSRGWSSGVSVPSNCTILTSNNKSVKIGSLSRGVFNWASCQVKYASLSLSPGLYLGDLDDLVGGTAIRNHSAVSNCVPKPAPCQGNCLPLDAEDKFGKVFDPIRYAGTTSVLPCECQNYSYDYCTITENSCNCKEYAGGFPKVFNYEFENCNYTFDNMKGHLFKYKDGDPIESNGVNENYGCDLLESLTIGNRDGSAEEECYWLECTGATPPDWDIYKITSSTSNPYDPLCPTSLCSITYDNNTANISLVGGTGGCFDIQLRNDCPVISITLPNNTFTFTDSINSECTECDVSKNTLSMTPEIQNPEWDIITETRTAILGYLPIEGNKNVDLVGGGGNIYVPDGICNLPNPGYCCYDACYTSDGAIMQCGQSAPGSWPWSHALVCNLNGSYSPTFTPCISSPIPNRGTNATLVGNILSSVGFAVGSDNTTVKRSHIAHWKELMQAAYFDISACHNNYNVFNTQDLVEGVVPGSCTQVKFEVLNYPMVAWRQTLNGGVMEHGYYGVHVAYFEYEYRRPRTIQDVFLKDNASKCATRIAYPASSSYNITEKYKIADCQTSPSCFDTKISPCNEGNTCCEQRQNNSNITSRP